GAGDEQIPVAGATLVTIMFDQSVGGSGHGQRVFEKTVEVRAVVPRGRRMFAERATRRGIAAEAAAKPASPHAVLHRRDPRGADTLHEIAIASGRRNEELHVARAG